MSSILPPRVARAALLALVALCALSVAALSSSARASIGAPPDAILDDLVGFTVLPGEAGRYRTDEGFSFGFELRSGLVYAVNAQGTLDDAAIAFASALIGAATGYDEAIAGPVATFFETRIGELSGAGPVTLGVQEYDLQLEVTGEPPHTVSFVLELKEVPAADFPPARHALGPADARFVIREFSDFQCPFCSRFAADGLPQLKEELLARGDVRFEYHHFPLQSIHANAVPAAEAAECVAAASGEEAFWTFHDALFERQQAWSNLGDPNPYFVRLAADLGIGGDDLASCVDERRFAAEVADAYRVATETLGLSGTPTVYVNGYQVREYLVLATYVELIRLVEAFETGE